MSETKTIKVAKPLRDKLLLLSKKFGELNTGSVGDNFWLGSESSGSYDWGQHDFGIDKQGNLLVSYQSGCSCYGAEEPEADETHDLHKPITLKNEDDYYGTFEPAFLEMKEIASTLHKVLTGKKVSPQEVIALPNAEVRRAVVELIGYDKIIDVAVLKDESEDGKLYVIKVDEDEDITLVHVKDPSTTREYFLRVPPKMKTAKQARAWTFGFEEEDFNLEKET